jgi:hypothetical protein
VLGPEGRVAFQDSLPVGPFGQAIEDVGDQNPRTLGAELPMTHLRVAGQELPPVDHGFWLPSPIDSILPAVATGRRLHADAEAAFPAGYFRGIVEGVVMAVGEFGHGTRGTVRLPSQATACGDAANLFTSF